MPSEILERIKTVLGEQRLAALVICAPDNVTYAAGYEIPSQVFPIRERLIFCVLAPGMPEVMIVPDMEASLARSASAIRDVREYNEFTEDPLALLASVLGELGVRHDRVAIEDDFLPGLYSRRLAQLAPEIEFVGAKALLGELRAIKMQSELDKMRRIGRIAERAHWDAAAHTHAGMTELELAQFIYASLFTNGAESVNKLVVGSGERSEHGNANATERRLRPGEIVRTDIFAKIGGYMSDVARTAVVGAPSPVQRDTWARLIEARCLVLEMLRPGTCTGDIYRVYRDFFQKAGLKPINFVGHGLGITLHEDPYISRYHNTELRPGMVLAVEPMHLVAGEGYQVEDEVVITETGYELITNYRSPEKLIVIN